MIKQGTVTLDVNDYDAMSEYVNLIKPKFELNTDETELTVYMPTLSEFIKDIVKEKYPDFKESYWNTSFYVKFEKKDSNA